jgi:predicted transcriptional regulator
MCVDAERDVERITELLSDEVVRTILEATFEEPLSAEQLCDRCEVSPATVYRRLQALDEFDLVDTRTEPDADGHHYKVYSAKLDRVVVDLTADGFELRITRRQRMVDRFTEFVEGLN